MKKLLFPLLFLPIMGMARKATLDSLSDAHMDHARISIWTLQFLLREYKEECWADSALDGRISYPSCTHEYCRDIKKRHKDHFDSLAKSKGMQPVIWSRLPLTDCYKRFVHREPTFEGFMIYIGKLK